MKDKIEGGRSSIAQVDSSVPDSAIEIKASGISAGVSFDSMPGCHQKLLYQYTSRDQLCNGSEVITLSKLDVNN
jgi:hypothetical protein